MTPTLQARVSVGNREGDIGPIAILTSDLQFSALLLYQGRLLSVYFLPSAIGLPTLETDGDREIYAGIVAKALDYLHEYAEPDPGYRHLKQVVHAMPVAWARRRRGNHTGTASDLARVLARQGSERVTVIPIGPGDQAIDISVLGLEETQHKVAESPPDYPEVVPVPAFSEAAFGIENGRCGIPKE